MTDPSRPLGVSVDCLVYPDPIPRQQDPCPWDCGDGNGIVDTVDFLAVLAKWGQVGTPCDFGLGNPGVDTPDFLKLLANWGPCLP